MARNFRVSVNGKSYDVVVDELGAAPSPSLPQQVPVQAPAPIAAPAPAAAPASPAPAAAPSKAPASGGTTISSPMPGKIWKMHVKEGDVVTEGQLVLVLEAMKMENEIFATSAGTVVQVCRGEGDAVNTGDPLVVIA